MQTGYGNTQPTLSLFEENTGRTQRHGRRPKIYASCRHFSIADLPRLRGSKEETPAWVLPMGGVIECAAVCSLLVVVLSLQDVRLPHIVKLMKLFFLSKLF